MPEHFVLWGSSGHAKVLASLIALQRGQVVALFDSDPRATSALAGVPIYIGSEGFEYWRELYRKNTFRSDRVSGLAAIGGVYGPARLNIHELFISSGIQVVSIIHPSASICPTAKIGVGTQILAQAVIAAEARIGKACIINHRASADHECVLGDGVHLAPGATLCGEVMIGDNVLIGAGAVVLPRVTVGDNAIVGAGAVVTKYVPPGITVVGNPARDIRGA